MWEKLEAIARRYDELTEEMARPEVAGTSAGSRSLTASAPASSASSRCTASTAPHRARTRRASWSRTPTNATARACQEELDAATEKLAALEAEIKLALLPKDPRDENDVIVEIRAGTGGEEAALFAATCSACTPATPSAALEDRGDVHFRGRRWAASRKSIFEVHGKGAYSRLKYESGVHRVQRVPATEAQGRIHTSTATVAVLPEAEEVDVEIDGERTCASTSSTPAAPAART